MGNFITTTVPLVHKTDAQYFHFLEVAIGTNGDSREMALYFLAFPGDINRLGSGGWTKTALQYAAKNGQFACLKFLVDHTADLDIGAHARLSVYLYPTSIFISTSLIV